MRTRWNDELIRKRLLTAASWFEGRMPSASELRELGDGALCNAIARNGGFYLWAERLGLEIKESETRLGFLVQEAVVEYLTKHGFRCLRQTTKAPYDLLVNRRVRLDVKSAHWSSYWNKGGYFANGYVFGNLKVQSQCDVYALCCLAADNSVESFYLIPATQAQVSILTITSNGKYSKYRNDFKQLNRIFQ